MVAIVSQSISSSSSSMLLPRIGLGMAALGRPGYINLDRRAIFDTDDTNGTRRSVERMEEQANLVMDAMMEECSKRNVIPWFDCARSYGLSEQFVGTFLRKRNIAPNDVYVSSKWGYTYVADWNINLQDGKPHEVKDHSLSNFLKQMEETAEHIGEYLNLYQVHSATFESGILKDERVHEAMNKCRQERGWNIGLSVSGTVQDEIIRTAMAIQVDRTRLFDSVQCTYNLLEQRPHNALMEAHDAGMDIIIKEGMANGRIFQNPTAQSYATDDVGVDQLALGCILAQPFQPRVLSGSVTPDQLISNMKAFDVSNSFLDDEVKTSVPLSTIMKDCRMESDTYWNDRSNLAWN